MSTVFNCFVGFALSVGVGGCLADSTGRQDDDGGLSTTRNAEEGDSGASESFSNTTESGALDSGSESTSSGEEDDADSSMPLDMGTVVDDAMWQEFLDARVGYLLGLATPILNCVESDGEPAHPLFNRCTNWHGYAHASYALHALYRLTAEESYRAKADALLTTDGLAAELQNVQSAAPTNPLRGTFAPYAHGWFLALAVERERATGATDLQPLANFIAQDARIWLDARTWVEIKQGVLSGQWDNIPWVVLNLWKWAQHTGDAELAAAMELYATDVLLNPTFDQECSFNQDNDIVDGFFAPCLHRFMVVGAILPEDQLAEWLADALSEDFEPVPLLTVESDFQGGLNFSRAWGLWQLYLNTGDVSWRSRYAAHISTHMMMPQLWNDPANKFGFWVPQFGVYALSLSFE